MLVEAKLPARTYHAPQLAERDPLVGDRAEHQADDGGVEALVLEGQRVGDGVNDLHRGRSCARCLLGALAKERLGLDRDE